MISFLARLLAAPNSGKSIKHMLCAYIATIYQRCDELRESSLFKISISLKINLIHTKMCGEAFFQLWKNYSTFFCFCFLIGLLIISSAKYRISDVCVPVYMNVSDNLSLNFFYSFPRCLPIYGYYHPPKKVGEPECFMLNAYHSKKSQSLLLSRSVGKNRFLLHKHNRGKEMKIAYPNTCIK